MGSTKTSENSFISWFSCWISCVVAVDLEKSKSKCVGLDVAVVSVLVNECAGRECEAVLVVWTYGW